MDTVDWHARAKTSVFSVRNLIDGEFSPPQGGERIVKHAPHDGTLLYEFGAGCSAEVDRAVASARAAFEDGRWRNLPVSQRQDVLNRLADKVVEHREEFGLCECLDVGKPITAALNRDIGRAAAKLRKAAAGLDDQLLPCGFNANSMAYQYRKAIGVVAAIIGWNYPLVLAAGKIGPALAMGNSLVLKPSEFTSLSAVRLAELALEVGVPPGVLNVIHGAGSGVGAALAEHGDVDMLTFTGSSATGKKLMVAAGTSNMKRVHLECGGKSANIVFDDCHADLDRVAANVVAMAFPNQGALCIAGSRLLIQEDIKACLLEKVLALTAAIEPRDPLHPDTAFGAIINAAHMNKVLGYIDSGKREGATLLYGGGRLHAHSGGYFIEPAVFTDVEPEHTISQEEIFGPVLSVFSFRDEAEAVQLANATRYGLAAHVSTANLARAHRMGRQLDAGLILITGGPNPAADFVNIATEPQKESGMGFGGGREGLEAYSVAAAVHLFS